MMLRWIAAIAHCSIIFATMLSGKLKPQMLTDGAFMLEKLARANGSKIDPADAAMVAKLIAAK